MDQDSNPFPQGGSCLRYVWFSRSAHFKVFHIICFHHTVLEPTSQRLWVIGGEDDSLDGFTSDVIKMSINTVPLRTLAIDHIARHMYTHPMLSLNNYPKRLVKEIEEHRSKIQDSYAHKT